MLYILEDSRHGARLLRRNVGSTAVAVLTLGLGVGFMTAMVGLVDALMFRPPKYVTRPERIVHLLNVADYVTYLELERHLRTMDVGAYTNSDLSLGRGEDAMTLRTQCVTPSFFDITGTRAVLGRVFGVDEDRHGLDATVVIASRLWKRHFFEDHNVIGRTVVIAGGTYTVVGVAPDGFRGVGTEPVDAWISLITSPRECSFTGTNLLTSETAHWLKTFGRLHDGVSLEEAEADVAAVITKATDVSVAPSRLRRFRELQPLYEPRRPSSTPEGRITVWLAGAATILLLVSCANVAGLLSIRAIERRGEIAVRLQLGATRGRLVVQLLVENILLACAAATLAWVVALAVGRISNMYLARVPDDALIHPIVLEAGLALAALAVVLSGIGPAIQALRGIDARALRGGRFILRQRSGFRDVLLVIQVALALVLGVAAGLFSRSLTNARREIGYDLDRVVVATVDSRWASKPGDDEVYAIFAEMLARVKRLDTVEAASLSSGSVLGAGGIDLVSPIRSAHNGARQFGKFSTVTPDYFRTLGVRFVRGRPFNAGDNTASTPVLIVDEELGRSVWPDQDPLGKCAVIGLRPCVEVVGVTRSRHEAAKMRPRAEWFIPLAQAPLYSLARMVPQVLLIRQRESTDRSIASIAAAVRSAARDIPLVTIRPLMELANENTRSLLIATRVFSLFGTWSILLAAAGLYALLAFSTRQRIPELGLRIALGATRKHIIDVVATKAVRLVAIGWAAGAIAAVLLASLMKHLFFNIAPNDPASFVAASLLLFGAALGGVLIPAIQAAQVDPAVALRHE